MSDRVNESLHEAGSRLGLSPEWERKIVWGPIRGPQLVLDYDRFALSGDIDGYPVDVSRDAQLRNSDPIPLNALRFTVSCDLVDLPFRVTTLDFANPSALELPGTTDFVIETDASYAVGQFLTPTRHRILRHVYRRWPIFEVQHDRFVIVERDVATDPDVVVDTMKLLLGATHAFKTGCFPE